MREDFSAGPAHEGRFFQRARPAHERGFFLTGRAGPAEIKMSFLTTGPGYKKKGRRIILRVSLGGQNKDEVFKPAYKRLIIYLI